MSINSQKIDLEDINVKVMITYGIMLIIAILLYIAFIIK